MNEPPIILHQRTRRLSSLLWLVLGTLLAVVSLGLIIFIRLQTGDRASSQPAQETQASFSNLPEASVPGRYRWMEGDTECVIVLYEDHTFMNKDGTTFPMYRWDLSPEGLSLAYSKATHRLTVVDSPTRYRGTTASGTPIRMEKLPPYEPAQLEPPLPIATILLGATCETNGLTPVNTGGDGQIFPSTIGGVECYQLVRKQDRGEAYLYLQIASELKDPPFTNALVAVAFFDAVSTGGGPTGLLIQYDTQHGPYANTQPLLMRGSQSWQEATFYLAAPAFQNRQNGRADFRISVGSAELCVRSVRLMKNTILPETKMPTCTPR